MSRECDICGKKPVTGYNVSHAHNKTKSAGSPIFRVSDVS